MFKVLRTSGLIKEIIYFSDAYGIRTDFFY